MQYFSCYRLASDGISFPAVTSFTGKLSFQALTMNADA